VWRLINVLKNAYVIAFFKSSIFIDKKHFFTYLNFMAKITYNTRIEEELIKKFKILAIEQGKRQNQLLEEAILDLIKKYKKQSEKK
ncbi:MAG: hypothetical protein QME06_08245, partial [Desulfobacterales bacterium]|nr:hypothetical protein [Desulfobacterales bacterium]